MRRFDGLSTSRAVASSLSPRSMPLVGRHQVTKDMGQIKYGRVEKKFCDWRHRRIIAEFCRDALKAQYALYFMLKVEISALLVFLSSVNW